MNFIIHICKNDLEDVFILHEDILQCVTSGIFEM